VDGVLKAADADGDDHGTIACTEAPGDDCDDADPDFVRNDCGGCMRAPLVIGDACGDCGVVGCDADDEPACMTPTPAPASRCDAAGESIEECVAGEWESTRACDVACVDDHCVDCVVDADCSAALPVCLDYSCVECLPGRTRCGTEFSNGDVARDLCDSIGSWEYLSSGSCHASNSETCNAVNGTCVTAEFRARDADFEVGTGVPTPPAPPLGGVRTDEVLDRVTGFALA